MPLTRRTLRKLPPTLIFIETGSHQGDGIQFALSRKFEGIYSVDKSEYAYGYCSCRFASERTRVHLFHKDSREFLRDFLPTLTTRATFWLDAHSCEEPREGDNDALLGELELIADHPIKDHVILIDDVRNFGTPRLRATYEEVKEALLKINPDYQITFRDSSDFVGDILVATL